MDNIEAHEKSKLISESLRIVKRLAELTIADYDDADESDEIQEMKHLIIKSRRLVGDRWWKLL